VESEGIYMEKDLAMYRIIQSIGKKKDNYARRCPMLRVFSIFLVKNET